MSDLLLSSISPAGVSRCYLRSSLRAKRIRIELRPDRSLLIVVPDGTREDQWLRFVLSKLSWIKQKLQQTGDYAPGMREAEKNSFPTQINLLCRQQQFPVMHRSGSQNRCGLVAGSLSLMSIDGSERQRYLALRRWLVAQAREEFALRLQIISEVTGLSWNRISIRGQKTRWGSCSAKGNISLNFKMLFLPSNLVDHVLLHELVHTREMNHSHRFWSLMRQFDPECDRHRAELKKAGQLLPGWTVNL